MILLYRLFFIPIFALVTFILYFVNRKVREGLLLRIRRHSFERSVWRASKLVWFHCASGEFEYAKPVIRNLKKSDPEIGVLVTYFSPTYRDSVERFPEVDLAMPLPLDLPGAMISFLKVFRPKLLAVARTDLWPECLHQCRRQNIPVVLFSATLNTHAAKRKRRLSFFWRWLYGRLQEIYVVDQKDYESFQTLNLKTPVSILGDSRYDQVFDRLTHPKPLALPPRTFSAEEIPVLVAGSTWAEDESVLIQVLKVFLLQKKLRLILVPHEPTPGHIQNLRESWDFAEPTLYSQLKDHAHTDWKSPVLIVDQVGLLAELYTLGDFAFVGGSYRKTVHSVMEPLAAGCATFVGPYVQNNREALKMSEVPAKADLNVVNICSDPDQFQSKLSAALELSLSERRQIAQAIREHTARQKGASQKVAQHLLLLLRKGN